LIISTFLFYKILAQKFELFETLTEVIDEAAQVQITPGKSCKNVCCTLL